MTHDANAQRRTLTTLSVDECRALVPRHGIGRVVFVDARGPVALPVNYVRDHDDFVFRTDSWSSILSAASSQRVSFEVDEIDAEARLAWSVLATGTVREIEDPADLRHVTWLGPTPWATGPRDHYLRLSVRSITGRRLVAEPEG